jgi:hypothetical protein
MAKKHTAQCACGAVKFEFNTDPTFVAVCHCLDCKKASGGEAATFFGVPEDDFTLISGEPKSFHYIAQSGNGLNRNYCPNCGARVFTNNLEGFPAPPSSSRSGAWITLRALHRCLRCSPSAVSNALSRSTSRNSRTCPIEKVTVIRTRPLRNADLTALTLSTSARRNGDTSRSEFRSCIMGAA